MPVLTHSEITKLAKERVHQHWHWFAYHFERLDDSGRGQPLAASIVNALVTCDAAMPGYAQKSLATMGAIGGKEKFVPHYEQLLQYLAELHIALQVVSFDWRAPVQFLSEPTAEGSKKNPELTVTCGDLVLGIEVKAPALLTHIGQRETNSTQIPARGFTPEMLGQLKGADEKLTLPRDNPVKDFLISANEKFESFKKDDPSFVGILVIVWDDHVYEPISSLLHPTSGLLTAQSFHRDEAGNAVKFPNVDGIFVVRHLHQLMRSTKELPLGDGRVDPLAYGDEGSFPFKVFIQNPDAAVVPEAIQRCLQGLPPTKEMGAEYIPSDLVWWFPA